MEEHIQPNESFRLSWDIPPRRSVELGAFFNIQLCLRTETGIKATRQVFEDLFLLPIEGNNGSNDYFAVHLDNPILTVTLHNTQINAVEGTISLELSIEAKDDQTQENSYPPISTRCSIQCHPNFFPSRSIIGISTPQIVFEKSVKPSIGSWRTRAYREFSLPNTSFPLYLVEDSHLCCIGGILWDCGIATAEFITQNPHWTRNKLVLELGSGTGIVGLAAAATGARVILTDIEEIVENLLKSTIQMNAQSVGQCQDLSLIHANGPACCAVSLSWGEEEASQELFDALSETPIDILLLSDVLYDPGLWDLLIQTLRKMKNYCSTNCQILLSHRIRNPMEMSFFDLLPNALLEEDPNFSRITLSDVSIGQDTVLFVLRYT